MLDTWFSSALWPHSTLGWPEQTPELAYYYPTSIAGHQPRHHHAVGGADGAHRACTTLAKCRSTRCYIHPKILDGYGETMSKTKGNGVDPLDMIEKFGTDALRFALAYMATETQDVRMPVEFECPHCQKLIEQTQKNRVLPRVKCKHCGQRVLHAMGREAGGQGLAAGAVVSERFELARNFCNKLWNAARFALMNLDGYRPARSRMKRLKVEDRWIFSRLATVTGQVTRALESYRFADAARLLYDFAWDEFCSFYVEMVKAPAGGRGLRPTAQRVLAHVLDTIAGCCIRSPRSSRRKFGSGWRKRSRSAECRSPRRQAKAR